MRRFNIATLASKTGANGTITADEVAVLRTNLFNGEEVWPPEVRALFALMHRRMPACDEFNAFIVEALSAYVVNELEPRGAVDEKNARWLIAMLRQGQESWSEIDLAVVRAVLEKAGDAPLSLQHFALEMTQCLMSGVPVRHAASSDAPAANAPTFMADPARAHPEAALAELPVDVAA